MTKDEQRYVDEAARLGCLVCHLLYGARGAPAEIHHRRTGTGAGKRSGWDQIIPLCPPHHRGHDQQGKAVGIHSMGRKAWERWLGHTEVELIELTRATIAGNV